MHWAIGLTMRSIHVEPSDRTVIAVEDTIRREL
jgi:hypothetical protein